METRRIWLVTKDGEPRGFAWANDRETAERLVDADHLDRGEPGWDATATNWRRVPRILRHPVPRSLEGRELRAAGCRWNLDDAGRARSKGEPDEPDGVLEDTHALQAEADRLEVPLGLRLKGSDERIVERPVTPRTRTAEPRP
jgi:hypothetical protein